MGEDITADEVLAKQPAQPAPAFSLNSYDWHKWSQDLIVFLAIPLIAYISQVLGTINQPFHLLQFEDFLPTNTTILFFVAYILNSILSLLKKYVA